MTIEQTSPETNRIYDRNEYGRIEQSRKEQPCPVLKSAKGNRTEQTIEHDMQWDTSRP